MHACNVITEARVGNSFANYPIHIQILYNTLFKTIIYYNFDKNSIQTIFQCSGLSRALFSMTRKNKTEGKFGNTSTDVVR